MTKKKSIRTYMKHVIEMSASASAPLKRVKIAADKNMRYVLSNDGSVTN